MQLRDLRGVRLGKRRRELLRRLWRREGWQNVIASDTPASARGQTYTAAHDLIEIGLLQTRKAPHRRGMQISLSPLGEELCTHYWHRLVSGDAMQWRTMRRPRHQDCGATYAPRQSQRVSVDAAFIGSRKTW